MMRRSFSRMISKHINSSIGPRSNHAARWGETRAQKCRRSGTARLQLGRALMAATLLGVGAPLLDFGRAAGGETNYVPRYNETGELIRPVGFDTWVFVGSNLGLAYKAELPDVTALESARAEKPEFHNVYINPAAYKRFRETGEFPNSTVLVMEKFKAEDREFKGVLAKGQFDGERTGFEVAVKNLARPDGSKTPWAYYDFTGTKQSATAFPDQACEACHHKHAGKDNVWIQLYPRLRDRGLQ